ncbi:MAG: MFS transporter [Thermomicrobiales bacterium]|nr:MFS transporter [Thermomicrobiales bacterium]
MRNRAEFAGADRIDPLPVDARRQGLFGLPARVLSSPIYRRIWLSGIIYYSARWVEIITSGWIVLALTGSPLLVGLTGFFRVLPMLVLGSLFGALADRFTRVNILLGIHAASLLAALILATTFILGGESLAIIYPMIFVLGCGTAADFSARSSLIDEVQDRSLLANTMSLESLSMSGAKITATIVAGFLLSAGGAPLAYGYLALLYAAGLIWLGALKRRLPARQRGSHTGSLRLISSLYSGWASALRLPVVRGVFFVTIIINVLIFPYQQLIAIVAGDILSVGPFWMGVLAGADGIGGILTAAWLTFGSGSRRQGALFVGGATGAAALLIGLALSSVFALSLAIQVAIGICTGLFAAHQAALVLSATPVESRARALGLIATAIGLTPVGMLLIGGLSSAVGAQVAIAAMAALGLIGLLLVMLLNPQLRAARIR